MCRKARKAKSVRAAREKFGAGQMTMFLIDESVLAFFKSLLKFLQIF